MKDKNKVTISFRLNLLDSREQELYAYLKRGESQSSSMSAFIKTELELCSHSELHNKLTKEILDTIKAELQAHDNLLLATLAKINIANSVDNNNDSMDSPVGNNLPKTSEDLPDKFNSILDTFH